MSSAVPEGWELSPLSSLANYKNGRAFKPLDWSKSGLPILRIAQINNPLNVEDYYEGDDIEDGHFVTKGDLIFSWSATLKAVIWSHYDAVLNQHIFKVTEKVGTDRSYLQQLLDYAIPKLAESSHGSTMKHIKKGVLDEFFAPIPPLPEQKKIASILTSVDEVIENTQKQIDKLQDLKKATMNELLTKGIGHTEFKDSELGRIPKSWEVKSLSEVTLKIGDGIHSTPKYSQDGSFPFINGNNLVDGIIKLGKSTKFVDENEFNKQRTRLGGDTILMSINGTIGNLAVYRGENVVLGKSSAYLTFINDFELTFAYYLLSSDRVQGYFEDELTGTTIRNLSLKTIRNTPIAVPPISEQNAISNVISSIDSSSNSTQQKLSQTQSLKKSLMKDLLTGKVRVSLN
jgi:type I restriction enzyme S subunit